MLLIVIVLGIIAYFMVGGVFSRLEWRNNVRACGKCNFDKPCASHEDGMLAFIVFCWPLAIFFIPALISIRIGDGIDYLFQHKERKAARQVEEKKAYKKALKALRAEGVNIPDEILREAA